MLKRLLLLFLVFVAACDQEAMQPQTPAPPHLSLAAASPYQVELSWQASDGATGYNVYRSEGLEVELSLSNRRNLEPVAATTFTDKEVTKGKTYVYVVTAVGPSGESAASNQAEVILYDSLVIAPRNLTASFGDGTVRLIWEESAGAVGYNVYRSDGPEIAVSVTNRQNATLIGAGSYTDTQVESGMTYYYVVTAVDGNSQESEGSEVASVALAPEPVAPCLPRSLFSCEDVLVTLDEPFILNWNGDEGGLMDKSGSGTGFTIVDPPSNRLEADGPLSHPEVPGYEPERLFVDTLAATLTIRSGKGVQHRHPRTTAKANSLVNGLGVGVGVGHQGLRIATTIIAPRFPEEKNQEQAGLWFGLDEDNYVKLVVSNHGGGMARIMLVRETVGESSATGDEIYSPPFRSPATVRLALVANLATDRITAFYGLEGEEEVGLGSFSLPPLFFGGLTEMSPRMNFAGIFATHYKSSRPLDFGFQTFAIEASEGDEESEPGGYPSWIKWRPVAKAPLARSEAQGAVLDGKLYVFGGYTSWRPYLTSTEAYVYDPAEDSWTRLADLPEALTHAGVVVDGRNIYLAGGYVNANTGQEEDEVPASREIYRYNVDEDRWYNDLPDLPQARGSGGFVRLGGNLHFFGGQDVGLQDRGEHWVLSLEHPQGWQALADLPNARNHLGFAVLDGKIYAIGGQYGDRDDSQPLTLVHRYDPAEDAWTRVADLPRPLSHHSSSTFVANNYIVVVGGEQGHNDFVDTVMVYAPEADSWTMLTPLPKQYGAGVGGFIDGEIIYHGGGRLRYSRDVYRGMPTRQEP